MDALGCESLRRMIEGLTEQIRANPDDTEALFLRRLLYGELRVLRRAAEDYGSIIALDPDCTEAYLGRAPANTELGDRRRTVEDYDAIRLAPGNAEAHYSRGRARPNCATWPGCSATSTWPSSWALGTPNPTTTRGRLMPRWESS